LTGGDNTAFIDQVSIAQVTTGLTDPGFEQLPLGPGGFSYDPSGSSWTFAGTAGVAGNGGAFTGGNPAAPEGSQGAVLQGRGGDNTAFIDNVSINAQATSLTDSGFEAVAVAAGGYVYNPTGSAWAFSNTAGVASNGSPFTAGNPAAPQGSQVLILQGNGSVTQ